MQVTRNRIFTLSVAGLLIVAAATARSGTIDETVIDAVAMSEAPFVKAAPGGKSLVLHESHRNKGTVYHALSERDRQIYFVSEAPLEKIKGQSNKVIGYVVAGPSGSPASLVGGEWHLPVKSMKTGIRKRDQHLTEKNWLDAESFPNIVFQLSKVEEVSLEKASDAFATYAATLIGEMTVHGVTQPITMPNARITLMPASDATAAIAAGDLLAIRVKFSITLSSFDVENRVIGNKVAENIEIDTKLYMSTVKPEDQPTKEDKSGASD